MAGSSLRYVDFFDHFGYIQTQLSHGNCGYVDNFVDCDRSGRFPMLSLRPPLVQPLRPILLQAVSGDGGSSNWYEKARLNSEGLSVFIPGHRLATGIQNGADGAYSNMACFNPFAVQQWYEQIQNDLEAGLELEGRINQFMKEFIEPLITEQNYSSQAYDRFLAVLGGWANVGEKMRWPYWSVPVEYADQIRPAVRNLIPEFF